MASQSVDLHQFDPLTDPRWDHFVRKHPGASVFHTTAWLEALRRTYGYEPFVLTTSPPGEELDNGIVFCRIKSRLTGRRAVSLPFSDHCEPLVSCPADLHVLLCSVKHRLQGDKLAYVEIRPSSSSAEGLEPFSEAQQFCWHKIDLDRAPDELFRSFHKDCVQRKIQRAEREALTWEFGRSEALLRHFYGLLILTRRRHRLAPQPIAWFRHLIDCLGDALTIRVAFKDHRPVASILTLRHTRVLVYKYGCSDPAYHHLGGVQLLFWRTIEESRQQGILEFDLGRTDYDNPGLALFKDRWGSVRSTLTYWRDRPTLSEDRTEGPIARVAGQLFAHMPDSLLTAAGRMLYRHIG